MTLTIYLIPNMEQFLKLVQSCCGEVVLHLPDTTMCSLKGNPTAQQILRLTTPRRDGLKLSFTDTNDASGFLRYMMEAAYHRHE